MSRDLQYAFLDQGLLELQNADQIQARHTEMLALYHFSMDHHLAQREIFLKEVESLEDSLIVLRRLLSLFCCQECLHQVF